jgi:hypothetical protein
MSYIVLARGLSPFGSDEFSAPWIGHYSHFPPVFPLLLLVTGGAWNFFVAHMVVALCALAALVCVYAYGADRLGGPAAGFGLAIVFLAMPTAWISILGILSEPLFLALSLATLVFHARCGDEGRGMRDGVILGLLLAATLMTRAAGFALFAAYFVHVSFRAVGRRNWPSRAELVALLIAVIAQLAWLAMRPHVDSKGYSLDVWMFLDRWTDHPSRMAAISGYFLAGGWISSFWTDSVVPLAVRIALLAIAALGLAGAVRGAMLNRLDSWYVLAGTAMLFMWVFSEDNTRRLLYPLVPLLLGHAAEMLRLAAQRLRAARGVPLALLSSAGLVIVLSAPATSLVARKALDREPFFPGFEYSASAITDYYTEVNLKAARAVAWRHAATLAGLELLDQVTPPDARVMWVRPEYVGVLGRRRGVPSYSSWDHAVLAREILRTGTTHVIASRLFKSDLADKGGDPFAALVVDPPAFLRHLALRIQNSETETVEFVLLQVDPEELKRYVGAIPR